jgi:signal transduction histidine kinase
MYDRYRRWPVTTAIDCDCEADSRVLQFPASDGETPWPDDDVELGGRPWQSLVAAVAHDLRNGLAGLMLWCDTLALLAPRLSAAGDEQAMALYRTVLEQINTLACRSVRVVDDLLDISRLEAGHSLPLVSGEVELVSLVQDVLRSRPETTNSGRVRLESAESELWGWGDADRLERVLDNLVSNAIKYSPDDETITVRVAQQNIEGRPHAVLEVEDSGIGIPADDLPHVFEFLHRARNVDPSIPGNGLGLWVSRAIVIGHGGTLMVASREGQGTTVTMRLPLSPASAEAPLESGRRLALVVDAGRLAPAAGPTR